MTNTLHWSWISIIRVRSPKAAMALAVLLSSAVVATQLVQAQTFRVLYSFTGGADGAFPFGNLARDTAGNLYGAASLGGDFACDKRYGCGTVFKLTEQGKLTVLHTFRGSPDGQYPDGGVTLDVAGNLYGTTYRGGKSGYGTVFKLDAAGKETILYSFTGANLAFPEAPPILDPAGNLYGTTTGGCMSYSGAAFKLTLGGKLIVLHTFTGGADGACPYAGLIRDATGTLYGTTAYGGLVGLGTAFKLSKSGQEMVLHSFPEGQVDGEYLFPGLVLDKVGNLYGAAEAGGAYGAGIVFTLDKLGKEIVLYSFTGGTDGKYPFAALARDRAGNMYGTTFLGGTSTNGIDGVVFKLDKNGKETVLHNFNGSDGSNPEGSLIRDRAGNLYGTTTGFSSGAGTVFQITP